MCHLRQSEALPGAKGMNLPAGCQEQAVMNAVRLTLVGFGKIATADAKASIAGISPWPR